MEERLIKEHSAYKYASDVKQICEHLFANTPIHYFAICRAYKNGDYSGLLSDIRFADFYLKNDYQDIGVERQMVTLASHDLPWNLDAYKPTSRKVQLLYDAMIQLGHGSGILIPVNETAEYKEGCIITTPYAADSHDPYLIENIPLLKNFILYFREKLQMDKQLQKGYNIRYESRIPNNSIAVADDPTTKFTIKKYYLGGPFNDIAFSKREAECLQQLFYGKTAKMIAQILQISHRTVESHIEKIKLKTTCASLAELCKKLEQCNLLDGIL